MQVVSYTAVSSPIGPVLVARDAAGLRVVSFQDGRGPCRPEPYWVCDPAPLTEAREQLAAYFAGELKRFDLPLNALGTDFQKRVWQELVEIPYGETITYGELARRIGKPTAARAVGAANGKNPLAIVVPCHRVVGEDGSLTGYGSGVRFKELLLRLEGVRLGTS